MYAKSVRLKAYVLKLDISLINILRIHIYYLNLQSRNQDELFIKNKLHLPSSSAAEVCSERHRNNGQEKELYIH